MSEIKSQFTIPAGLNVGACCANDNSRYVMACARLQPMGSVTALLATDGKIMAIVPVATDVQPDDAVWVPKDMAKAPAKHSATVSQNGEWRNQSGTIQRPVVKIATSTDKQEGRFPQLHGSISGSVKSHYELRLNVCDLKRLADAISTSGILSLYIPTDEDGKPIGHKAIGVVGDTQGVSYGADAGEPLGIGAIMPLTPDISPTTANAATTRRAFYDSTVRQLVDAKA